MRVHALANVSGPALFDEGRNALTPSGAEPLRNRPGVLSAPPPKRHPSHHRAARVDVHRHRGDRIRGQDDRVVLRSRLRLDSASMIAYRPVDVENQTRPPSYMLPPP